MGAMAAGLRVGQRVRLQPAFDSIRRVQTGTVIVMFTTGCRIKFDPADDSASYGPIGAYSYGNVEALAHLRVEGNTLILEEV